MKQSELAEGPGRIEIRADERHLTAYAGLALVGELCRRLRLARAIEGELARVGRARPVKRRRRGLAAGAFLLALAESQLAGGECFDDLEQLRADEAGAPLRAVAGTPSAPTGRQLARRFRRVHLQAAERALARVGGRLDAALGRDPAEPVTIDMDATTVEVYGRRKRGAGRTRQGALAYCPQVCFWAERGRALASELYPGNKEKLSGGESARLALRALRLLPKGHGEVRFRVDSAYYALELFEAFRKRRARFSVSVPRTSAMWAALERIPAEAWQEAKEMAGAEVAEASYTPQGWQQEPLRLIVRRVCFSAAELARSGKSHRLRTIPPEQLALALGGELDSVYGYSFILSDLAGEAVELEHVHRHRAQIEERLKEAKLGQALRHLPSGDANANRVWLAAALLALNLAAFLCDLSPAAAASGQAEERTPLRRHAKRLRQLFLSVPARIVRSARRLILRLPAGFRHGELFRRADAAIWALPRT